MTKVKICGITRPEDAARAKELGADYLGFVFVDGSPRCVTPERAKECGEEAAGVQRVGVFRNATLEEIVRAVAVARLDLVQMHDPSFHLSRFSLLVSQRGEGRPADGDEQAMHRFPVIHAFRVTNRLPDTTTPADYVLFDTGGGTGRTFDWSLLAGYPRTKPFFLAGGITPKNVAEAIRTTQPFAIDLASGVERAPGIKDHDKMKRLFEAVQR